MSQAPQWGVQTTGPADGSTVFTRVLNSLNALLSSHSGATEPAYRVRGTLWEDTTTNRLKRWDGTTWRILDPASNLQSALVTTAPALTAQIPLDNTLPQWSEGTALLSAAITPRSVSSKFRITFVAQGTINSQDNLIAALFVNSGPNAIKAGYVTIPTANYPCTIVLEHIHSPASLSQQTYAVRMGPSGPFTATVNGNIVNGAFFGGVAAATLIVEEILP